jgi:hypothetical protein
VFSLRIEIERERTQRLSLLPFSGKRGKKKKKIEKKKRENLLEKNLSLSEKNLTLSRRLSVVSLLLLTRATTKKNKTKQ